jgi:two-component system nitrate/nitrite response regulator NarL
LDPEGHCTIIEEGAPSSGGNIVAANKQPYATVLVGESILLLDGLAHILRKTNFQVVTSAARVDRLVPAEVRKHKAILLLLEAGPDVGNAIRQVESFRQLHAAPRIAAIARALSSADIGLLFRAGVHACFIDSASIATFLKSLELVMLGQTLVPEAVLSSPRQEGAARSAPPSGPTHFAASQKPQFVSYPLSPHEGQILRNLAQGHSNKFIARYLGTAESTVKVHVKNVLRKIGVVNRTQAAVWAMNRGLLRSSNEEGAPAPESSPSLPSARSARKGEGLRYEGAGPSIRR